MEVGGLLFCLSLYIHMGKVVNGLFVKSSGYGMVFILTVGTF